MTETQPHRALPRRIRNQSPIDIKLRLCCLAVCFIFGIAFIITAVFIWVGIVKGFISTENEISPQLVPLVAVSLLLFGCIIPCCGIGLCIALPRMFEAQNRRNTRYQQFGDDFDEEHQDLRAKPLETPPIATQDELIHELKE